LQIDFSGYINGIVSFLARNFYTMKIVALVLAFSINFMLLFYKATALADGMDDGDDVDDGSGLDGSADFDNIASGSGANATMEDGEEEEEDEDIPEFVHMNEKYYYMATVIRMMSVIHSIVSLAMLVAYYHLKASTI
jgi:ryanodine receptor 2